MVLFYTDYGIYIIKKKDDFMAYTLLNGKDLASRMKQAMAQEVKELTEPVYNEIVEQVKAEYENVKEMDPEELAGVIMQIKESWDNVKLELENQKKQEGLEKEEEKSKKKRFFGKRR